MEAVRAAWVGRNDRRRIGRARRVCHRCWRGQWLGDASGSRGGHRLGERVGEVGQRTGQDRLVRERTAATCQQRDAEVADAPEGSARERASRRRKPGTGRRVRGAADWGSGVAWRGAGRPGFARRGARAQLHDGGLGKDGGSCCKAGSAAARGCGSKWVGSGWWAQPDRKIKTDFQISFSFFQWHRKRNSLVKLSRDLIKK
jgi:hypothetical protein